MINMENLDNQQFFDKGVGVRIKCNILLMMLIIILVITSQSKAQEFPKELINKNNLRKILKVDSFEILKNKSYKFEGYLKVEKFGKYEELFCILEKYQKENKGGYKTFVAILSKEPKGFKKEKIFEFRAENIDFLSYKNGLIYVTFTGGSDDVGWIKWKEERFQFEYFYDPEM